jgi:hypothetical protein
MDALQAILRLKMKIISRQIAENQDLITKYEQDDNMQELTIHLHMHNDLVRLREQIHFAV